MKLIFLLLSFSLNCWGRELSWKIPPGLEDGYYGLSFDETKENTVTFENLKEFKLDLLNAFEVPELNPNTNHTISARDISLPVSKKGCQESPRNSLDPADHYIAKMSLSNWCDSGFPIHWVQAVVGVKDTMIYWVCNHNKKLKKTIKCSREELIAAEAIFNQTCGEDKGAWVQLKKWKKTYGRMTKNGTLKCGCL